MSARLTRQHLGALARGDAGVARVSRFVIEVLGDAGHEASNTLDIDHYAFGASPVYMTRQALSVLGDSTVGLARVSRFMFEALGPKGEARTVTDTLSFTHATKGSRVVRQTLSLTQVLTQAVARMTRQQLEVLALSTAAATRVTRHFFEALGTRAFEQDLGQTLGLAQAVTVTSTRSVSLLNVMALVDTAAIHYAVANLTVEQTLSLVDTAKSVKILRVEEAINFVQVLKRLQVVVQSLDLEQDGLGGIGPAVTQYLNLDQTLSRRAVWNRTVVDGLNLQQAVLILKPENNLACRYAPQVGSGETVISTTAPTIGAATLTLFYPFSLTPTDTLALRNPEFGNRVAYNANRINRKSRRGTKRVFREETWPDFQTLKFDISLLSDSDMIDFTTFAMAHLGEEIGLLDAENRTWRGVLTTPDFEITQIGGREAGCENMATSFEFEGRLDDPA